MKSLFLLLLTAATAILCLGWVWNNFEFSGPIFAFLVNWLLMAWVAISGQIVSFPLLPGAYYDEKSFEKAGRIYEILGIRFFKAIVRRPPFTLLSPTLKFPAQRTETSLKILATEMKKAETGHLLIFLLISGLTGYALFGGQFWAALWLSLFNILFNGYPIALQRYNRIKLRGL